MQPHVLTTQTKLNASLAQVFEFFSRAENLNQVTPPHLHFKILTPLPLQMKLGAVIDYQIQLSGIPFHWRTLVTSWEPPYRFVDEQMKGPYKLWHHEHIFEQCEGYVLMTDRVHFLSPGWFLEPFINRFFVEPKVKEIFRYRDERFKDIF